MYEGESTLLCMMKFLGLINTCVKHVMSARSSLQECNEKGKRLNE